MTKPGEEPLSAARATDSIREMALRDDFGVFMSKHAIEQIKQRDLILDDVLYVLKRGFVYEKGEPSARPGYFRYKMECKTPNSGRRTLRVVVVPSTEKREATIVTAMWADEPIQRG